jgi:hypothetical protein
MDIFEAEMGIMLQEAPEIQKSLGMGAIGMFVNGVDDALEMLDELIIEGFVLVFDASSGLWNLAKPIKRVDQLKNATIKAANATKNAAIKGWQFVAPIVKDGKNKTVGAWKYAAPRIGKTAHHFRTKAIEGWQFVAPKAVDSYNKLSPHVKNATIAGWKFLKPLPGHTINATVAAWNYVAPKAENVVKPALNFVADMIGKGFDFITSQFSLGLEDIDLSDVFDDYPEAFLDEEYEEVLS